MVKLQAYSYLDAIYYDPVLWSKEPTESIMLRTWAILGCATVKPPGSTMPEKWLAWRRHQAEAQPSVSLEERQLKNLGILKAIPAVPRGVLIPKLRSSAIHGLCTNWPVRPFLWESGSIYDLSTVFPSGYFKIGRGEVHQ